jgi:hypothetical protein
MFTKILVTALEAAAISVLEGFLTGAFTNGSKRRIRKIRDKI